MENKIYRTGGVRFEKISRKDYHFERMFGAAKPEPIVPFGRSVEGIPSVCQFDFPFCVPCTVTFGKQSLDPEHPDLSSEFLAGISRVGENGIEPQIVLDKARNSGICTQQAYDDRDPQIFQDAYAHRTGGDARVEDLSPQGIYNALKKNEKGIMVGVKDWHGAGAHMMWAYDVVDEKTLKGLSWSVVGDYDYVEIPMKDVVYARAVYNERAEPKRFGWFASFVNNSRWLNPKIVAIIGIILLTLLGGAGYASQNFGASGVYSRYRASLSRGTSDSATSIYVTSLELKSGEEIGQAGDTTHFPLYFTIQPESSIPEDIECWGVTTGTTPYLSGCVRGISFLGSTGVTSTVSTLARSHSEGEGIIISNSVPFFNRFMDNWTEQVIDGVKRFISTIYIGDGTTNQHKVTFQQGQGNANPFIYCSSTSTCGWSANGIDTYMFNASGTAAYSSSTAGLFLIDSKFGIRLGSQNLTFDNAGNLVGYATGTAGEDLMIGQAVVVSSTASNAFFKTNTNNVYSTFKFVGFVATTTSSGSTTLIATPGTTLCAFSGLVPGTSVYLYGTAGAVSSTPAEAKVAKVGYAITDHCLQVAQPHYEYKTSYTAQGTGAYVGTVETKIVTGFFPAHIKVYATIQDPDPGYVPGNHWSVGDFTLNPITGFTGVTLIANSSSTNPAGLYNAPDWSASLAWAVVTSTTNACGSSGNYMGNCGTIVTNSITNDGFSFTKQAYSALQAIITMWIYSN